MSPIQYDPNATSPIDRDELRALVCRARDIEAQRAAEDERADRAEVVVVNRIAVAAWLGR
jgi:hypothetical protein